MTPNWARVKTVFAAALEEPADNRAQFLAEACGPDADLLREVESLLASVDGEDGLLGAPDAVGLTQFGGQADRLGARLGPYRLVRELGRGGMGAVYLASREDGAFEQEVALKVINRSVTDRDLERRFRTERQVLASLNHPHIARLLDGGVSASGEPFLVMEYVAGEPLLAFAARNRLSLRARLRLFRKVCAAVSYAHAALVVHRDLKPSNVLVTEAGEPKLIDFGLAKIIDETIPEGGGDQTITVLRAFTPAYASPEQIHGHPITTASDIYSLGVVLYELLCGRKPFDFARSTFVDIVRTLDTTEAERPSAALGRGAPVAHPPDAPSRQPSPPYPAALLEGDLDNIVLMAMRREPQRRYASVAALSDDVHRYLEGRPVSAHPQTWRYRATKFAQRNTVEVVAAGLVVLTMLGGTAVSLWQARIARDERDRATRRFNDVRRLSNSLLFEISPNIERLPGATEARDQLVRRALEYLDTLATESSNDLELQSELASAYEKIGDLQGNPTNPNLIELDAAIRSYAKAREIRTAVTGARPDATAELRALAENYRVLGSIYSQANDFENAARDLGEALARYERLSAAAADDLSLQVSLAQVTHDLGRNHSNSSRYAGALAPFERSIAAAERVLARRPNDVDILRLLADTRAQYGLALSWEARQPEAEAEMARAAAIYEPLVESHPADVPLRNGLWSVYWLTSSVYEEANDTLSHQFALKALDTMRDIAGEDRANIRGRQQLAKSYSRLGQTATNTGQSASAVTYLNESVRILSEIAASEARNGRLRSELALALTRLAEARLAQGQLQSALADATRAAATFGAVIREFPGDRRSLRNVVVTHQVAGEAYERLARDESADPSYRARARSSYREALDVLMALRDQGVLAGSDAKLMTALEDKVARLSVAR